MYALVKELFEKEYTFTVGSTYGDYTEDDLEELLDTIKEVGEKKMTAEVDDKEKTVYLYAHLW